MTIAEWISAANKLLKADPNLSYQQVEQKLAADGHKRPSGITQKGSSKGKRFGKKSKRTPGQDIRRKGQELTSTEKADQANKVLAEERQSLQGIAETAGMSTPHREHLYSQDIAGDLREGAPGDYIQNVPSDIAAAKTALEQRIRTRYNNRYAVGLGVNGLRVIPREFFDELVSPDDLPGIDIDETASIDDQINVLQSIYTSEPPKQLGGFQTQEPRITSTAGTIRYKPKPLEGMATDYVPMQPPLEPKQDLTQQVIKTASDTAKVLGGAALMAGRGVLTLGAGYLLK